MGLVASQARLLMSFARKSDIEYRAQVVCNRRMRLSFETSEVARVYADKLSNVTSAGVAQAPTAPAPTQQVQTTQGSAGNTSPLTSISLDELTQANLNLYESSTNYRVYNMDSSSIINGLENGSLYLKYINPPAGADPCRDLAAQARTTRHRPAGDDCRSEHTKCGGVRWRAANAQRHSAGAHRRPIR